MLNQTKPELRVIGKKNLDNLIAERNATQDCAEELSKYDRNMPEQVAANSSQSETNTAASEKEEKSEEEDSENPEDKIEYVWSRNPDYLLQYFKLREDLYRKELGFENFVGELDEVDPSELFLFAVKGAEVIAGVRFAVKSSKMEKDLSLEEEGFKIDKVFPGHNFYEKKCVEYSRLVVKEQHRNSNFIKNFYKKLNDKVLELRADYILAHASYPHARRYKIDYKKFFGVDIFINDKIKVPYNPKYRDDVKYCICLIDVKQLK